jgi:hypothetical protein
MRSLEEMIRMTSAELMVKVALASWKLTVARTDKAFSGMIDEQFYRELAPGRNRPVYLLGHLTAVHDAMLTILGLGDRLHPELDPIFLESPDRSVDPLPAIADLKADWEHVNAVLLERFSLLTPEEWLQRHTAMTDEEYAKDPTRNRLGVLLNRTGHTAFHLGQLRFALS